MTGQEYVDAGDVDLDVEEFFVNGQRLTEERAEEVARETLQGHAPLRERGRPSLTGSGQHSPTINARVPQVVKTALRERAEREHVRESQLVRRAVEEFLAR